MNVPISFRNLHNQKTALFQFERCLGEPLIFFFQTFLTTFSFPINLLCGISTEVMGVKIPKSGTGPVLGSRTGVRAPNRQGRTDFE